MERNNTMRAERKSALRAAVSWFKLRLACVIARFNKATKNEQHGIMYYLFRCVEELLDRISGFMKAGDCGWIQPDVMDSLAAELADTVGDQEVTSQMALETLKKLECVSWSWIDRSALVRQYIREFGCHFSCFISGNIASSQYLDVLFYANEKLMRYVREFIEGRGPVQVSVVDRHLNTPSSCIILVQFIYQLQNEWQVGISGVDVTLDDHPVDSCAEMSGKEFQFSNVGKKMWFLQQKLKEVLGVKVKVETQKKPKMPQGVFFRSPEYQLDFSVDEGISYYWEGSDHGRIPTYAKLWDKPMTELQLTNIAAAIRPDKGIHVQVRYAPRAYSDKFINK